MERFDTIRELLVQGKPVLEEVEGALADGNPAPK